MKQAYSNILICILSVAANAQPVTPVNRSLADSLPRLIAHAGIYTVRTGGCPDYYYIMQGDSTTYTYSADRGGDLNHAMYFDISRTYKYDTTIHGFKNVVFDSTVQTFDGNNRLLTNIINNYRKTVYTYDNNDRVLAEAIYEQPYLFNKWMYSQNFIYTYDASGNLLQSIQQMGDTSNVWHNQLQTKNTYNTDDKLVHSLYQTANMATNVWVNSSQSLYNYGNNYHYQENAIQNWDTTNNAWVDFGRFTRYTDHFGSDSFKNFRYWYASLNDYGCSGTDSMFTYDLKHRLSTVEGTWYYGGAVGCGSETSLMQHYVYDDQGRMIADTTNDGFGLFSDFYGNLPQIVTFNDDGNHSTTYYTYNRFGQITSAISGLDTDRYYYDDAILVRDSTQHAQDSINNLSHGTNTLPDTTVHGYYNMHVFPVPASDLLTIDLRWDTARSFSASLICIDGKTLSKWDEQATKHYIKSIPVNNIPAGSYILKISFDKGDIIKRIVVAHR